MRKPVFGVFIYRPLQPQKLHVDLSAHTAENNKEIYFETDMELCFWGCTFSGHGSCGGCFDHDHI